ncbi:MAG TPA: methyltransferase domain-containing protein [Limnochordia bacterium]|nr:methyltransferase domain-containing protein [Limnochordia bacterium]
MNQGISKKEQASGRFEANIKLFRCPVCKESLATRVSGVGVCCANNHCFDLARKGYLNLFMGPQACQYNKELFVARQKVFGAGVYDPLVSAIAQLIGDLNLELPRILDAGCGEGSFLSLMSNHLRSACLIGLDIARDGISLATSHRSSAMWLVADLANLPLQGASMDAVLNILSPANYGEFHRVLKPGGVVIKVLPGGDYLAEIRDRLPGVASYSNAEVLSKFGDHMNVQRRVQLHYSVKVTDELWEAMVDMTPLSQKRQVLGEVPQTLTIDLQVLQGSVV